MITRMRAEKVDRRRTESPAVWFEVPAENVAHAGTFYDALFGAKIGGGLTRSIVNCVNDSSVRELAARVEDLGGEICLARRTALEMGYFVICRDNAGQMFRVWEATETRDEYELVS